MRRRAAAAGSPPRCWLPRRLRPNGPAQASGVGPRESLLDRRRLVPVPSSLLNRVCRYAHTTGSAVYVAYAIPLTICRRNPTIPHGLNLTLLTMRESPWRSTRAAWDLDVPMRHAGPGRALPRRAREPR